MNERLHLGSWIFAASFPRTTLCFKLNGQLVLDVLVCL
jgi:hypothetical protein